MPTEDINNNQEVEFDHVPVGDVLSSESTTEICIADQTANDQIIVNNKIPHAMYFIVGNEVCERFSYYGLKTILSIYCTDYMGYTDDSATVLISAFNFLGYAFPLVGAYFADARIGKYKTILYFSMLYCVGGIILSVTSVDGVTGSSPSNRSSWGLILGLLLIAISMGGIKPSVSAFCGDQLQSNQKGLLQKVFQIFYWSINLGSFFSTILTPMLRKYTTYWIAFGVPAVLLILSTIIFVIGSKRYINRPVAGSVLLDSCKVIGCAVKEKVRSKRDGYDDRYYNNHWIDRAKVKHDPKMVDSVRAALKVMLIFVPMPFFWALYDQTSSRWTQSAEKMDLSVTSNFSFEPDQIQAVNPLLIMILVPVFEYCLYRPLKRRNINFSPLLRMVVGMWLAVATFLLAMFVERKIESEENVSIFWQLPQYVLLTCAEILISITGLEFSYSQAPASMKSMIMSLWLFTDSIGNLIIIVVIESFSITPQWKEYLVFALIMTVPTIVFMYIAYKYQPVDPSIYEYEETDKSPKSIELEEKKQDIKKRNINESQRHLEESTDTLSLDH
ncbi:hypothetical protein PPL_03028 [Heterostelium album PN500]|uniref:Peptide transporter n=1 Tax=Heterostelium pallidum (strain ATCC 26659 / Pp 5 / PN500) TaxID=670386 RepID=D3B3R0_HETP5|nr:hypothetical protein PPL_03028 [Heterostelium album PN500]EFA83958.1 hypothetical protein PPL_03028 [Heterostelium album PN500]|eukprot:XP_020436075.1 hypothetical protein PPL_03028 [Heterostelium album PN500]